MSPLLLALAGLAVRAPALLPVDLPQGALVDPSPSGEIWELDQLRIARPVDEAKLRSRTIRSPR